MSSLEEKSNAYLERRQYCSFEDEVPPEKLIKDILNATILATPVKNDMYGFSVKVFGPDYHEEKFELLSHTSCCSQHDTYKEEIEMYRRLCDQHMKSPNKEMYDLVESRWEVSQYTRGTKMLFNTQVLSPWLFRFDVQSDIYWRGSDEGKIKMKDMSKSGVQSFQDNDRQLIGLSMFAINLCNIAKKHGLDSAFTGCIHHPRYHTKILEGKTSLETPFVVNLGYGKGKLGQRPKLRKPKLSQVVNFA